MAMPPRVKTYSNCPSPPSLQKGTPPPPSLRPRASSSSSSAGPYPRQCPLWHSSTILCHIATLSQTPNYGAPPPALASLPGHCKPTHNSYTHTRTTYIFLSSRQVTYVAPLQLHIHILAVGRGPDPTRPDPGSSHAGSLAMVCHGNWGFRATLHTMLRAHDCRYTCTLWPLEGDRTGPDPTRDLPMRVA